MNQILVTSLKNKNLNRKSNKNKFYMIFVISLILLILIFIYIVSFFYNSKQEEKINQLYLQTLNTQKLYSTQNLVNSKSVILGKIKIPKINLDYMVFNEYNEDLLKISICKFYGNSLEEKGNIGLAGHNYNDERFFGKLNKLEIGDEVILQDLQDKKYVYIVNNIYESNSEDLSCLEYSKKYEKELTLITCNNKNGKRIVVKAGIKQS